MAYPRRGYQGEGGMRGRQDEQRARSQGSDRGWRSNDERQERGNWRSGGEQGWGSDEREDSAQFRGGRDDLSDRNEGGYGYPSSRYANQQGSDRDDSQRQWQGSARDFGESRAYGSGREYSPGREFGGSDPGQGWGNQDCAYGAGRSRSDYANDQRGMGGVSMGGRAGSNESNQWQGQQRFGGRMAGQGQGRWSGRDESFYRPSGWSGGNESSTGGPSWGGQQSGGQQWNRSSSGYGGTSSALQGQSFAGRGPKDYRRSDERIREEISDRLTDDDHIDASEITVQVQQGEVTLSGTVPDREQKRHAEDLAESISGVREVTNNIRVSRGQQGSADRSQGQQSQNDRFQEQSQGEGKAGTNKSKSAGA